MKAKKDCTTKVVRVPLELVKEVEKMIDFHRLEQARKAYEEKWGAA
jgi:hypothetical protein